MPESRKIKPVTRPVQGVLRPPGSKSITNRALILAALAEGTTELSGVLDSLDTRVMVESLHRLGFRVSHDTTTGQCRIMGRAGRIPADDAKLWLENSGTSIRFLTSLCCLGSGSYRLDGTERMRQRPIGDLVRALRQLGATIDFEKQQSDCPPVIVRGSSSGIAGGAATIQGSISSQFLTSLLMALPSCRNDSDLQVAGTLVSVPYVTMTVKMMKSFGVPVELSDDLSEFHIPTARYTARNYEIEPDASAASYLWGAAAVTGGQVTVKGLHRNALQGDVEFATALEQMGCQVIWDTDSVTVSGSAKHGIDIDMNAVSDTAQTLAAVAVFADSPTTIRNVEHIRHKETDRISAVVTELRRVGIRAEEFPDGFKIYPGSPRPAAVRTYEDHRMAMSFSLLGLCAPGIEILDPECTGKTYPGFFDDLDSLCETTE
ncbi:MAG: 3-phosphoshikimate 1-carboxyvinyltransferase [Fuerstiella sp.]|nr:3-phosphoshikimate 1-carboxyvinyltransferase [Fuerstiella sp.]